MRCYICDAALTDAEVSFNKKHGDWDPCVTCQEVIDDVFSTSLTEEEIDEAIEWEETGE